MRIDNRNYSRHLWVESAWREGVVSGLSITAVKIAN